MNKLLKDLEFKVFTTPLEKAGHSGERRLIRGYASVGDVLDRQNEVITLGALVKAREDLLKNHTIFYEHKHSELPIGKTIAVDIDEKGLLITVEISKGSHADSVWTLIQEGILNSFSIGGRVLEAEEVRDKKTGDLFNEITRIELFETSVVGLPANPAAKFELISKSFRMAITEELRKKREVSNTMAKETEKEVKKEVETKETTEKTVEKKEEVTKSEEKEVEKTEESKEEVSKEKKVEKSEEKEVEKETKEEVSEEKEVEKKEEVEETREDKKARLLKEIENIEVEEEAEKEANAKISTEKSEEKEEVVKEKTSLEEKSSEEKSETTVQEDTTEKPVEEKSIDEQILEKLSLILDSFNKKEEVKEEVEVEKSEEKEEEVKDTCENCKECDCDCDKEKEEVKTEAPAEKELAVAKSEKTSEKAEDKDLEKVVKVEDVPKEAEEVSKEKETPTRKGEVIIAETPYSSQEDENKIDAVVLKKLKEKVWSKMIFGDK